METLLEAGDCRGRFTQGGQVGPVIQTVRSSGCNMYPNLLSSDTLSLCRAQEYVRPLRDETSDAYMFRSTIPCQILCFEAWQFDRDTFRSCNIWSTRPWPNAVEQTEGSRVSTAEP